MAVRDRSFAPPVTDLHHASPLPGAHITSQPAGGHAVALDAGGKLPASAIPNTMIHGQVDSSGNITGGSGDFGASRTSTGIYAVTYNSTFTNVPTPVGTVASAAQVHAEITTYDATGFTIRFVQSGGTLQNTAFTFIAVPSG